MADDIKAMLGGARHALDKMRDAHGSLSAKLSPFELLSLGIAGAEKAHEIFSAGGGGHAGAGEYEPLIAAPLPETEQRLIRIAQLATALEFERYTDDMADYMAQHPDAVKRKRLGKFLLILGKARGSIEAGMGSIAADRQVQSFPSASYASQPSYGNGAPYLQPMALEPPHPHELLIRPFVDAGARDGWLKLKAALSGLDREAVRGFAKMLREYTASLREGEAIKTALALSNNLAVEFFQRFGNAQAALPAPDRR